MPSTPALLFGKGSYLLSQLLIVLFVNFMIVQFERVLIDQLSMLLFAREDVLVYFLDLFLQVVNLASNRR